jgi:Protein of unknown function (DUF1176)
MRDRRGLHILAPVSWLHGTALTATAGQLDRDLGQGESSHWVSRSSAQPTQRYFVAIGKLYAVLAGALFGTYMAASAATPVQSYDTYKSWLVACDNTLRCEAKGFDDEGGRAELSITREGGRQGRLHAVIAADSHFNADDIMLDGQNIPLTADWDRADAVDGTTLATKSFIALRDLIEQIKNGKALTLAGNDARIPLDGLTAALLRMDDRQGRVGDETALLNPGPLPAAKVLAAPRAPYIPAHPITTALHGGEAASLIAETRRNGARTLSEEQCDTDVGAMEPAAYALDQRHAAS